jgi:hypothetical protein
MLASGAPIIDFDMAVEETTTTVLKLHPAQADTAMALNPGEVLSVNAWLRKLMPVSHNAACETSLIK